MIKKLIVCSFGMIGVATTSCSLLQNSRAREMAIHCTYDVPIVNWDNSISTVKSEFDFFYSGKLVLLRYPEVQLDQEGHPSINAYLVYNRDSTYGMRFSDNLSSPVNGSRVPVDTFSRTILFDNTKLETALANMKPDSMRSISNGDLMKVFNLPTSPKYPEKFKVYLYYSKEFADIPYSFTKILDSVKNKKLYLIRHFAEGYYYEKEKVSMPPREYILRMTKLDSSKERKVDSLFNEYKRSL